MCRNLLSFGLLEARAEIFFCLCLKIHPVSDCNLGENLANILRGVSTGRRQDLTELGRGGGAEGG